MTKLRRQVQLSDSIVVKRIVNVYLVHKSKELPTSEDRRQGRHRGEANARSVPNRGEERVGRAKRITLMPLQGAGAPGQLPSAG